MLKHKLYRSKAYLRYVGTLPCSIHDCNSQACAHHLLGHGMGSMSSKASDLFTMPLCLYHHTGSEGIHSIGTDTWEYHYRNQWIHIVDTLTMALDDQVITLARLREEVDRVVINLDDRQYLSVSFGLEL